MKSFSKIMAGMLLASVTMFCACGSAEEVKLKDTNVFGYLLFAQDVEKIRAMDIAEGYMPSVYFDDLNSMLLALQAEKIDRISEIPQPVAEYIYNHNKNLQVLVPSKNWQGNLFLCMGTMQKNTKVTELLNSAIKELKESGKLDALQKKYVDGCLQKGKEPKPVAMPKIKDAPVIKVAVTGDYPPIDLVAADGTPAGFNVAMLAEIAKLKKVNIIPIPMNSGARFLSLSKGIVDAIFFIDEAVYNNSKYTEIFNSTDIPKNICITDVYAKYPIRHVERK
ncbi:MAG: transporter substrate-binding domain-containing protein [Phascolarctobacterium sp.]|nr:transporter substrate-binding domain-containing protein [Candidatus Phascolarctobacterium caballi]